MRINILSIGKTQDKQIELLLAYYLKRLPRHWNTEFIEIPEVKNTKNLSVELLKKQEEKLLMELIEPGDLVVLLDEKGKQYTSREFASKLEDWMGISVKKIHLIIGGAYGFSPGLYERANEKIALSTMTFTHQMVRLFLIEQLYRADQIQKGKPYHND